MTGPEPDVEAPARLHGIGVGDEVYLFTRPYDAERYAWRIRAQNPRRLGVLPVFDAAAADALITKT